MSAPVDILAQEASEAAALSFVEYRKNMGKRYRLTDRAAKMIARSLGIIKAQGGDADEALDMAQERGWMTMKPDWYWNMKQAEGRNLRVINGKPNQARNSHSDATARQIAFAARAGRTPGDDCF